MTLKAVYDLGEQTRLAAYEEQVPVRSGELDPAERVSEAMTLTAMYEYSRKKLYDIWELPAVPVDVGDQDPKKAFEGFSSDQWATMLVTLQIEFVDWYKAKLEELRKSSA
jgi:hypothetical protein